MIEERLEPVERPPFGALLRRRRLLAGLSQEQLAERAHISVQAVSALERGVRYAPRPDTLALLVKTLDLAEDDREDFESVARASVKQRVRHGGGTIDTRDDAAPGWDGPVFADAFFGRARERAQFARALHDERCITIWGTGGVGKTRLVAETLRDAAFDEGGRIVFVPLATALDDGAVVATVAEVLGVADTRSQDIASQAIAALGSRRTILILDNCEHVVDGVSTFVEALLGRTQTVTVVCTSREPLRISSEHVVKIGPLEQSDSIRLFRDRARLDEAGTQPATGAVSISTICRRLDGVPLAVELAAARVPSLGLARVERALDERFALLTRGRRTVAARHQTLRATIAWSYALLSPVERIVFERVALINGRFSLEEAIAISTDDAIERWDVVDAIAGLIEKAILSVVDADGGFDRPYLLLESTRAFAMNLLPDERADPDIDASQRRLGHYLLSRVQAEHWPYLDAQGNSFEGIDPDSVRGFLHWAIDEGRDAHLGGLVTGFLRNFWDVRGLYSEGLRWSEAALRLLPEGDGDNEARIAALRCTSVIHLRLGRYAAALDALKSAYALAKRGNNRSLQLWTVVNLAKCAAMAGDHRLARERADESLRLFDEMPDEPGRAVIWTMEAFVAMQVGDLEHARSAYTSLVAHLDAVGGGSGSARLRNQALVDLAEIEYGLGNFAQAVAIGRRNVAAFGDDNMSLRLSSLSNLTIYLVCSHAFDEAESYALRGLQLARETGNTLFVAMIAQACAIMTVYRADRIETAAEIFGWTGRLFGTGDLDIFDRMTRDRLAALLATALSEEDLKSAMLRGELLREDDVAELAYSLIHKFPTNTASVERDEGAEAS